MKSNTLPFDYRKAINGHPICTRGGGAARFVGLYAEPDRMCFLKIQRETGEIHQYRSSGRMFRDKECPADLLLVDVPEGTRFAETPEIDGGTLEVPFIGAVQAMAELLAEMATPEVKWTGDAVGAELQASALRKRAMEEIAIQLQRLIDGIQP
jgi:hypothetical protein